jgi:hypothetical protein
MRNPWNAPTTSLTYRSIRGLSSSRAFTASFVTSRATSTFMSIERRKSKHGLQVESGIALPHTRNPPGFKRRLAVRKKRCPQCAPVGRCLDS